MKYLNYNYVTVATTLLLPVGRIHHFLAPCGAVNCHKERNVHVVFEVKLIFAQNSSFPVPVIFVCPTHLKK
jgi:hypothetical protein